MNLLFPSSNQTNRIAFALVSTIVLLITFTFMPRAQAQVANTDTAQRLAMQAQITQLLQLIQSLQAQVSAMNSSSNETSLEGGFTDRNIAVGREIQTTDSLKVRTAGSADSALIGVQNPFSRGTVINGPRYADGYTWWQISYQNGRTGWSAENWLRGKIDTLPVDMTEDTEEEEDAVMPVKCLIESSKRVVTLGDRFEIDWDTDLTNPTLIDDTGERAVSNSGTRRYASQNEGTQQYSIGSSNYGIACSVDVKVVTDDDEDETEEEVEEMPTRVDQDDVCPYTWTRSLQFGNSGADVRLLKKFLNSNPDTAVYYEDGFSRTFNQDLAAAINKFQVKYRAAILSPLGYVNPTGTFNPSTMAKANSLCMNRQAVEDEEDNNKALQIKINELIAQIQTKDGEVKTPSEEDISDMTEAELQAQINELSAQLTRLESSQVADNELIELVENLIAQIKNDPNATNPTVEELVEQIEQLLPQIDNTDERSQLREQLQVAMADTVENGPTDDSEENESLSDLVLQMAVDLIPKNQKYDVDQSGNVTVSDALEIRRVEAGLAPTGPATTKEIRALIDEWEQRQTVISLSALVLQMAVDLIPKNQKYDVDQSGNVTVSDALEIRRVEAGLAPTGPATTKEIRALIDEWEQRQTVISLSDLVLQMAVDLIPKNQKYDVDQSGNVTVSDALAILRVETGLTPSAPATTKEIRALIDEWVSR